MKHKERVHKIRNFTEKNKIFVIMAVVATIFLFSGFFFSKENDVKTLETTQVETAMMGQTNSDTSNYEEGKIYSSDIMGEMITTLSNKVENNNLTELRKYIKEGNNGITDNSNAIQYDYNLNINLYTRIP